jgi:hypothetical protein
VEYAGHGNLALVRAPGHHWPGRLSSDICFEGANLIEIAGASLAFSAGLSIGARRSLRRGDPANLNVSKSTGDLTSRRRDKIHC